MNSKHLGLYVIDFTVIFTVVISSIGITNVHAYDIQQVCDEFLDTPSFFIIHDCDEQECVQYNPLYDICTWW